MKVDKKQPGTNFLGPKYYQAPNLILITSGIIYFVILVYGLLYPKPLWYSPLYWCVQSALIGSVADWFAVQALFRKPLGISFHTAIVPRKKAVLVNKIVDFVETKLLSKSRMELFITQFNWYEFVDNWMMSEKGLNTLKVGISSILLKFNNEDNKKIVIDKVSEKLPKIPVDEYVYRWLWKDDGVHISYYYQNIIKVLYNLGNSDEFKNFILQKLTEYIENKSWLERTVIENAINKNELTEVFQTECLLFLQRAMVNNTEEYNLLYSYWEKFCLSFAENGEGRKVCKDMYQEWLKTLPLTEILEREVFQKLDQYLVLGEGGTSIAGVVIAKEFQKIWYEYSKQDNFKIIINKAISELGISLLLAFYDIIGKILNGVLNGFDYKAFNKFIEDKVGYDLGWIRINGAIVGAVTGLLVWIFLEGLYIPYIIPLIKTILKV